MVFVSKQIAIAALLTAQTLAAPISRRFEEVEKRAPRRVNIGRAGRGAGQALEHAANAATIAGAIESFTQPRDLNDLHTRAPRRRVGGGTGPASVNIAGAIQDPSIF